MADGFLQLAAQRRIRSLPFARWLLVWRMSDAGTELICGFLDILFVVVRDELRLNPLL